MNENITNLVNKLNKYRESYYNGEPEVPDEKFDFEERKLKELDPNNSYFDHVGTEKSYTRDIKVEHEIPMLSMQKVQVAKDAIDWYFDIIKIPGLHFNDINPGLWIDPKLDGISGKVVYDNNGNYLYTSTRGNGKIGAKILFGDKIDGVPKHFLANSELRGEFIINKKYRKAFNGPLRNSCAGILKRKEYTDDAQYVSFVIYDVHTYSKSNEIIFKDRKEKLDKLSAIMSEMNSISDKFHIVPVEKTIDINKMYEKYIKHLRNEWPYETDGIIMTIDGGQDNYDLINSKFKISSCNRFNMALKPPALFASSTVRSIDAFTNRMKISFVAKIDPITIGDITCSAATLNNYTDMNEKHIGIGTTVLVNRANDVIPKIVEAYNEEGSTIKYINITKCPVCGAPVMKYNRDLVCTNEYGCSGIYESKLLFLLKVFEVKNIGPSTVHSLVELYKKYNIPFTFASFIKMNEDGSIDKYISEIFGKGTGKYNIYKKSIKQLFDNADELKLMGGFSIPFTGVSELANHNIKSVKSFLDYISKLNKSISTTSAFDSILVKWMSDKNHSDDLLNSYNIIKKYCKTIDNMIDGAITYCISGETTGYSKQEVIDKLKIINPKLYFVKNFNGNTNYLISEETGTTKVIKAIKYNIPVLTLSEMIDKFKK